jgi:uncharacterized low-complexity protein
MGADLAGCVDGAGHANAAKNPVRLAKLGGSHVQTSQAATAKGKCGEGKCGSATLVGDNFLHTALRA